MYILIPALIFKKNEDNTVDRIFSGILKMAPLIIILGYILVIAKLFEFVSVLAIFIIIAIRKYLKSSIQMSFKEYFFHFNLFALKLFEKSKSDLLSYFTLQSKKIKFSIKNSINVIKSIDKIFFIILVIIVFGFTFYLRFFDPFTHAAPALSDSYVSLEWTKYVLNQHLFETNIYPYGSHISFAFITKFSFLDALLVNRYVGSFNTFLIVLGLYYFVARMTGKSYIGTIASSIYGIFGFLLPIFWERQAAVSSQEFAYVFIMPTLYFYYKYTKYSLKSDFFTVASGLLAVSLIHNFSFALLVIMLVILHFSNLFPRVFSQIRKALKLFLTIGIVTALSFIPILYGLLIGKKFNQAAEDFLTKKTSELYSITLSPFLTICLILLIVTIILIPFLKFTKYEYTFLNFSIFTGLAAYFLYIFGGILTKSELLTSRGGELLGFSIPIIISAFCVILVKILSIIKNIDFLLKPVIAFSVLLSIILINPLPSLPYKLEYDSGIEQYFRISKSFRPSEWLLVWHTISYPIIYGKGYHIYTQDLIENYNPQNKIVFDSKNIPENIFIFHEKEVYRLPEFNSIYPIEKPMYDLKEKQKSILSNWIKSYEKSHDNISLYYTSKELDVYYIHNKKISQSKNIWN